MDLSVVFRVLRKAGAGQKQPVTFVKPASALKLLPDLCKDHGEATAGEKQALYYPG
jgi:hypothetical protein